MPVIPPVHLQGHALQSYATAKPSPTCPVRRLLARLPINFWTKLLTKAKVEEYHKSLKQNASMGKAPTKTLVTQATHFFAAVLAYTKLEVLKLKCGLGHFRLKAQLYAVGLKAMYQQLGQLRA